MKGPISKVRCKDRHCGSLSLESYLPIAEKQDNIFEGRPIWTKWFSTTSDHSRAECPGDFLVNQVQCRGKYCKEVRLSCRRLRNGFLTERRASSSTQGGQCQDGSFVKGMICRGTGDLCRRKEVFCAQVKYNKSGRDLNCNYDLMVKRNKKWTDVNGHGCDWYALQNRCRRLGHVSKSKNFELVANNACCVCGGGQRLYDDPLEFS